MRILTNENTSYELSELPDAYDELKFCVYDNSLPNDADYYFNSLIYLEIFMSPALVLKIGKYQINMPLDWFMLIGEPEHGELELIPLSSLNDRGFKAFCVNPLTSFYPSFLNIEILDIFTETRWFAPKIKPNNILCVPLTSGNKPLCAYFAKEITRATEIIKYNQAW